MAEIICLFPMSKNALKSKDLDLQKENKSHGENLFVQGRIDRREPPSHRFKSRSKSREKNKFYLNSFWFLLPPFAALLLLFFLPVFSATLSLAGLLLSPVHVPCAVNNDDDEVDGSDGDEAVSSQSESDDDNAPEEGEFQTLINPVNPVNPVTENTVQQWESSQWFSNARYNYTQSGAFLDIGSGSPVDDIIESDTVRLLD
ncbi:hypothetical protein M9H77_11245 [Catharanthus roseus]|uniref:Uncharacterized protein n=1 Tax=Catharanthus roseus TaxID=4058 RepID=A0ACC0BE20_CATRO|nr:hypothetical protein M9H77_11245 [Catharanthus roseus]